jgi:hypothetical protein
VLLAGCSSRALGGAEGSDSGGTTASETTGPVTTGAETTTTASTTTTAGTSTGPDPDDGGDGPRFDLGELPDLLLPPPSWPEDCPTEWGPGTWIQGTAPWGEFTGNRAWFGVRLGDPQQQVPRIYVLGKDADVAQNLSELEENGAATTGPGFTTEPAWPWPDWQNTAEEGAVMVADGQEGWALVQLTISGRVGNWDEWDPEDPMRLLGSVEWVEGEMFGMSGQFDAAYCAKLNHFVWGE